MSTMPPKPPEDLEEFQFQLADQLARLINIPLRAAMPVVTAVTAGWSVEVQRMRPVSDPHDRFVIHTPWTTAKGETSERAR